MKRKNAEYDAADYSIAQPEQLRNRKPVIPAPLSEGFDDSCPSWASECDTLPFTVYPPGRDVSEADARIVAAWVKRA